jgi:hypothetical protein
MLKTEMKNSLGQIKISDNVSNNTSINEEQQSQVNYFSQKAKPKCYHLYLI